MADPTATVAAEFRSIPRDGETHNGDAGFIRVGAVTWLSVIDGLGHGEKAAEASGRAIEALEREAVGTQEIGIVMAAVDVALAGSRGAGALLCRVGPHAIEVCSVGNVALRSHPWSVGVLLTAGILGRQVRGFRILTAPYEGSGRLMLFSDGIRRSATLDEVAGMALGEACDAIVAKHRDINDDSTVLIASINP
ncbi:MAG: hypothetical protein AAF721_40820 [Myxococcota bacterium]